MNILQRIFSRKQKNISKINLMDNKVATFSPWSGNAYENDIYRGAVDVIARNAAKLKGSHVIKYSDSEKTEGDHKLNRLLQIQPNPYMSAFDTFYKLITHYFLYNNAFAYIEKDDNSRVCVGFIRLML